MDNSGISDVNDIKIMFVDLSILKKKYPEMWISSHFNNAQLSLERALDEIYKKLGKELTT